MSDNIYNILWVDDEYEKLGATIRSAKDFGLKLIPFKSFEAGVAELEKNLTYFDGILLDAKFFEKENDVAGSEDTDYVHRAKERILQLPKKFDIHILTGQAEAFEDKTFNKVFTKVFRKGVSDDEDALFNSLRNASEKQEDFQIRHEYQRVFEIGQDKYLGKKVLELLLNLIKQVKSKSDFEVTKDNLLSLRKIIENLVDKLFQLNLIPEEIHKSGLNSSVKFLCNNKSNFGYTVTKEYMHPSMAYFFDNLVFMVQDSQHDKIGLKFYVDEYISQVKSPYLFKSLAFQMLDILIWLKQFIDEHPNPEDNQRLWTRIEISKVEGNESSLIGQLRQDEKGNYYLNDYIFSYETIHGNYNIGDKMEITKSIENKRPTKDKYPFFITHFNKIG